MDSTRCEEKGKQAIHQVYLLEHETFNLPWPSLKRTKNKFGFPLEEEQRQPVKVSQR